MAAAGLASDVVYRRAVAVVARAERLKVRDVLCPRGWHARRARQTAVYLAVTEGNAPLRRVARAVGCSLHTVQKALRRVEDLRDDGIADGRIELLGEKFHATAA